MTSSEPRQTDLPTQYAPAEVEAGLYERWVERGLLTADAGSGKPPYTIVIPPPNVTGSLHLGHAFQHTLMDTLTRRKRMQGYEVLWLPGMDHAGIATQTLVERHLLATEGKRKQDFSREDFVARVWDWKAEYGGRILGQMRRLGDGVDWSRERFTMDEGLSRAVQTIFKRLYDDQLIYRAERIINWCPQDRTALSDIEVKHWDEDGELVSLRYDVADGSGRSLVVATTRVETMLGDTAVAVHPDDERYADLVGLELELPLVGRRIPVVADKHVDPSFGTGAVKVTPAHDPNDFEIGQRHSLPMPSVLDEQGRVAGTGLRFDGMDRWEARAAVKEALREQGRVVGEKSPYTHSVGHCERCDTVIEPRLSQQWFVRVGPLAQAAGDAVRDGRVAISPADLEKRYFDWVDNMHDWCISRQLWWGHRIPVWYGPDGQQVCVGPDEQPPGTAEQGWTQDPDVLDTWFSSALWPFSTLGWPDDTADLRRFYPTDVLLTGYDIIFFWVARMMMFGLYAMSDAPGRDAQSAVPFKTIVLTGLVRDQFGRKMSKSKGNVIDPLDWMDAYGSDALRFTLARGANPGTDVPIGEEWVQGSRNFCTKLWNATRFALMNGATTAGDVPPADRLEAPDRWVLSRLTEVVEQVDRLYEGYEFAKVAETLYHFAWDEVCDWYLELAKVSLGSGDEARAQATRRVLGEVLDQLLRLLHPVIPFVTERLWTAVTGGDTVVTAAWPQPDPSRKDEAAVREVERLQHLVTEVRRFRSEQGLKPGQRVAARLLGLESEGLGQHEEAVRSLTRLSAPAEDFAATASLTAGAVVVELDLRGTIDVPAERRRLEKDLAAAQKERAQAAGKLGNDEFLGKAPAPVIDKVRGQLAAAEGDIARIESQLAALPAA